MAEDAEIVERVADAGGAWGFEITAEPAWETALPEWRRVVAEVGAAAAPALAGALAEAGTLAPVEIALLLADDESIREINRDWRDKDAATNVLSFATWWDDDCPAPPDGAPLLLGDIAVARETLFAEAERDELAPAHHFAHLLLHGVLHLIGYDHQEPDEAQAMEALETRLLADLGIADPHAAALFHGDGE